MTLYDCRDVCDFYLIFYLFIIIFIFIFLGGGFFFVVVVFVLFFVLSCVALKLLKNFLPPLNPHSAYCLGNPSWKI